MDASSQELGAGAADDDEGPDDEQPMQVDGKRDEIDLSIVKEILKIFDSRQLTDKIEATLAEVAAQQNELALRDLCLSVSHICSFILINSRVKIHETL